jgi:hypothetical protein
LSIDALALVFFQINVNIVAKTAITAGTLELFLQNAKLESKKTTYVIEIYHVTIDNNAVFAKN